MSTVRYLTAAAFTLLAVAACTQPVTYEAGRPVRTPAQGAANWSQYGVVDSVRMEPGGYKVTVRMDDGSYRYLTQQTQSFKVGDRVRIVNGVAVVDTAAMPPQYGVVESVERVGSGYRVKVLADDGSYRVYAQTGESFRVGDRVRIADGTVVSTVPSVRYGIVDSVETEGTGHYRMRIRMDDGSYQVLNDQSQSFRAGDRVRIANGLAVLD
jgi:outer membrane lipoprotein SlyB